ncbi:hypothetical protein AXF42_Ash020838 [Apostasia shenzhenica]|uniref:Uncharacterized protein n=1 Tax=Apostasia shenzhenica TaxID=1088818 RepID=A0A2I0A3G0_9ASPA|nr:hypothetical protein AXF42_Ash020838 [Apostasia shenzhenica]
MRNFLSFPSFDGCQDAKKKKEEKEKKEDGEKEKERERKKQAPLGMEGIPRSLGDRLYEIRRGDEKILRDTSQIVEVIKKCK